MAVTVTTATNMKSAYEKLKPRIAINELMEISAMDHIDQGNLKGRNILCYMFH